MRCVIIFKSAVILNEVEESRRTTNDHRWLFDGSFDCPRGTIHRSLSFPSAALR